MAVGLFLLAQHYLSHRPLPAVLQVFNQVSLGIYLIHPFLMRYVFQDTFRSVYKMTPGAWPILINYSLTLLSSFIIVYGLSKIPWLKKLV
jgi:surface polysaccharide O-acyltransferase-like enzyme